MPKRWLLLCWMVLSPAWGLDAPPPEAVPAPKANFNFDQDPLAKVPPRFTPAVTGQSSDIKWEVRQDHAAPTKPNVLVQSGKSKPGTFALLLLNDVQTANGEISVRFKVLAGEDGQILGLVFRYTDPQNYYAIVTSSRDDMCTLYRVKKGKVKILDEKQVIVTPHLWHELTVTFNEKNYTAIVDSQAILGGKDSTFLSSGSVGLVTLSDAVVAFDNFQVSQ